MNNPDLKVEVTVTQEKDEFPWFLIGLCIGLIFCIIGGTAWGNYAEHRRMDENARIQQLIWANHSK